MKTLYEKMEAGFQGGTNELGRLAADSDWRVRYAAAVAIGLRKQPVFLPVLEKMLQTENARPLFSQPATKYIGTEGDTRYAEQVHPIEVMFPEPADEETKEAWKTRGRVIQAVLFALHEIGSAHESLLHILHGYVEDPSCDYSVKAAAVRALGAVGGKDSLPYCETAANYDEWCTATEARKALDRLKRKLS